MPDELAKPPAAVTTTEGEGGYRPVRLRAGLGTKEVRVFVVSWQGADARQERALASHRANDRLDAQASNYQRGDDRSSH